MDRTDPPWRALDAAFASSDRPGDGSPDTPDGDGAGRPWWLVAGLVGALALGTVAFTIVASGPEPVALVATDGGPSPSLDVPSSAPSPRDLVVHVAGAVRRPGLVHLAPGSRIADAIDAAGGLGPRVDVARVDRELNLAEPVEDGERVIVPSRDDPSPEPVAAGPTPNGDGVASGGGPSGPVDLNHASESELDALPGIGPVTAGKIIAARTERPFASVDELLARKVVGQATLAKIRDLVVVH